MKPILLVFLLTSGLFAATYYVDSATGNNSNPGTEALPWLTIQRGADSANDPGDVVYVKQGTYNEQVTLRNSGTSSAYNLFVGYPGHRKPIMRGFFFNSRNYIKIIGFEIFHNSTSYTYPIIIAGTSHHIEILHNYMHHSYAEGGMVRFNGPDMNNIVVRGNELYYGRCAVGVAGSCAGGGMAVQAWGAPYVLVEYNKISRCGDYIDLQNSYSIVRNNYMSDFDDSYWPDAPPGVNHADNFQTAGGTVYPTTYHVYESNFMTTNIELNSHILQMRANRDTDNNIIFRGNVSYHIGSYALQSGGVDSVYLYNNTYVKMNTEQLTGGNLLMYDVEGGTLYSTDNFAFNNIFSNTKTAQPLFAIDAGCAVDKTNNVCYSTGGDASCVSTSYPSFIDTTNRDFHISASSPAIDTGRIITEVTSADGSGTTFNVSNAKFFTDGFGITEGDVITIGENTPVRIASLTSTSITVESSITWETGDAVLWRNQDDSPDIGAYEYLSTGYNYSISISNPLPIVDRDSFTVGTNATASLIRFVEFWVNGIPVSTDFDAPFSYLWLTGLLTKGSQHIVEVRAYPLYADSIVYKADTVIFTIGKQWNETEALSLLNQLTFSNVPLFKYNIDNYRQGINYLRGYVNDPDAPNIFSLKHPMGRIAYIDTTIGIGFGESGGAATLGGTSVTILSQTDTSVIWRVPTKTRGSYWFVFENSDDLKDSVTFRVLVPSITIIRP